MAIEIVKAIQLLNSQGVIFLIAKVKILKGLIHGQSPPTLLRINPYFLTFKLKNKI